MSQQNKVLQKLVELLTVGHKKHIFNIIFAKTGDIKHYWSLGPQGIPIYSLLKHYQAQPEVWNLYSVGDKTCEVLQLHLPDDHMLLVVMEPCQELDFKQALQQLKLNLNFKTQILNDVFDILKRILRNFIFDKYLLDLFLTDQFILIDTDHSFYLNTPLLDQTEKHSADSIKERLSIPLEHPDDFSTETIILGKKFKIEAFKFMEIVDIDNTYAVTGYRIIPLTIKENSIFENYRFLNQMSIPMAIFDPKSRIQFKNKAWVSFFQDNEAISFIKPINTKCVQEKINIYDESTIRGHFIKWYFDPIVIEKSGYTLITAIDSTHNKKEKIETLKTVERLKQSNQDLERFAHICGHDLKEPLRTISSFSQLLKGRIKGIDETSQNYLDLIIKNTLYMKNLIEDLLRYSEFDLHSDNATEVSTFEVLQDVLNILSSKIKEKRALIKVQDDLPLNIFCNKTQIMQIFQNLINNGLKFNNKKIPIINIGYIHNENVDRFFIKDNGMGIHKDYVYELFTMFKRLHNKNDYQGSGIGLAMCKKIIENHKGKIWIESELSKGTTVYFEFPKNTSRRYKCVG